MINRRMGAIGRIGRNLVLATLLCGSVAGLQADEGAEPPVRPSAAERLAKLKEQHGEELIYQVDEKLKLIFASSTDAQTLAEVRERLSAQALALQAELFPDGLNDYVTVVLPREWKGSAQGLYNPDERSIIAKTPGAQLNHEFTHALHIDHMQALGQVYHQNWIIEGLACFCETTKLVDGKLVPLPNHRTKIILNLAKGGRHAPWAEYLTWNQREFMKHPGNHYSQGRYMFIYLHATGMLGKWYQSYVENFAADPTGAVAFEKVFAKPLAEIERDWLEWLLVQPLPDAPAAEPATAPAG